MAKINITEGASNYNDLEKMSVRDLLENINKEDISVPITVSKIIPVIEQLVKNIADYHSVCNAISTGI